jgi:hypothetical protein
MSALNMDKVEVGTTELIGFGRFSGFLKREVIKEVLREIKEEVL